NLTRDAVAGLNVPLIREGEAIGTLNVFRDRAEAYSEREIALLETFADQAVIAIENANLFEELQQRNAELSEALEQQTATAEVLRVIAESPTDVDVVFERLLSSALALCGDPGDVGAIMLVEGQALVRVAIAAPPGLA